MDSSSASGTDRPRRFAGGIALALLAATAAAESPLSAFEFLAGHCWQGAFENGAVDTHCFTWVYGGKHLRDAHVVRGEGPAYRGETIYSVDGESGGVIFRYWNSLGGVSDGRIAVEDGALVSSGEVYVGGDGVAREFRSTLRRLSDERYEALTEELVDGEWRGASRVEFRRLGPAKAPDHDP